MDELDVTLLTTGCPPDQSIERTFGYVSGGVVYSRNIGTDVGAAIKNLVGGEIRSYSKLLEFAREEATKRLRVAAAELGANTVLSMRLASADVALGAVEIYAYGTAVVMRPLVRAAFESVEDANGGDE